MSKDAQEIRQQRLRDLVKECGSQAKFAKRTGLPDNYVSRMLSRGPNRKGVGGDLARKIEDTFGKPFGWLDGKAAGGVRDASTMMYGQKITEAGVRIGVEWEKLEESLRTQIANLIETLVAAQVRAERAERASRRQRRSGDGGELRT